MSHLPPQADSTDLIDEDDCSYQGQSCSDIIRREVMRTLLTEKFLCDQMPDGQVFSRNTDDQHLLNYMPQLQQLYTSLITNDDPPVEATFVRWAQRPGVKLTKLGEQILLACRFFAERAAEGRDWQDAYAHHQFHPVVAVMFGAIVRWGLSICGWGDPTQAMIDSAPETLPAQALRQLVGNVRLVCRSQAFQNLLGDHERKVKENFRSGCDYITKQFEQHASMWVLRIELYFRPDTKGWGYGSAADLAVTKYLRSLRLGRPVAGYLGFVISRGNGIRRGMHYQLMLLLDGHEQRNTDHLTRLLGEAWIKRVGADKGSYFNGYGKKNRHRHNGVGWVHVSDTEKLMGIRIAMWRMSQQSSVLKVEDSKVKNFWRGCKVKDGGNCGARGKNGHDLDLVKRLLGGQRSQYPPGFEPPKNERAGRTAVESGAGAA